MKGLDYLLAANIIIWTGICGYLVYLLCRYRELRNRLRVLVKKDISEKAESKNV
jgi:CcmD family protein